MLENPQKIKKYTKPEIIVTGKEKLTSEMKRCILVVRELGLLILCCACSLQYR